jgi:heme A synthase
MYSYIFTAHIIGALLFFVASIATLVSLFRSYKIETYRKLAIATALLIFGECVTGSVLTFLAYEPLNYLTLCGAIGVYTLISITTLYILKRKMIELKAELPVIVYPLSFAGIIPVVLTIFS